MRLHFSKLNCFLFSYGRLRWASNSFQEQNKVLISFLNLYSYKVTPPRSENHFAINDYRLTNFIIIWPLVRNLKGLIILRDKQYFWLMEYSRAFCKTHTQYPSQTCHMLLNLSPCSLVSSSVTQCATYLQHLNDCCLWSFSTVFISELIDKQSEYLLQLFRSPMGKIKRSENRDSVYVRVKFLQHNKCFKRSIDWNSNSSDYFHKPLASTIRNYK